ncbi:ComF family protein [Latilactobacillus sakei]|nr:ComF family protein [Latilactobacillus sakei]AUX11340.1 ComF family protein [Latilactobacillus sakei]
MCQNVIIEKPSIKQLLQLKPLLKPHICQICLQQFEPISGNQCSDCSRPLLTGILCSDCQHWRQLYPQQHFKNQALFTYNRAMQLYFQRYKGQGDYQLRLLFERDIQTRLPVKPNVAYVPIPSDEQHQQARGFNPVQGLFENCFPLMSLLKKRPTEKGQAQKNRAERLASPQFFELIPQKLPDKLQSITILDDIYTTGRTLWHAQQCLRARYPQITINAITLAR